MPKNNEPRTTYRPLEKCAGMTTVEALKKIGAPPWKDSKTMRDARNWYAKYTPKSENPIKYMTRSVPTSLLAPEISLKDLMDNVNGGLFSLDAFAANLNTFDARKTSLSYGVPMYFILGDLDYVTPVPLVEAFVAEISAPHKEVIILKGDGHNAILANPDRFLAEFVRCLGVK